MSLIVSEADSSENPNRGERLQRVLAERGVASRRKSEELIRSGRVTVNGTVVTELGTRVDPINAAIRVDGKPVRRQPYRYVVLHKPSGFITTMRDERDRHTVMDLIPKNPRLVPVGRLDRDTEGLLIFTNDGEVANRIMHPRYQLTKEYTILTPAKPDPIAMQRVRNGIVIDGKRVVPSEFRIVRETPGGVVLSIVIHEGMNHIVRRLMAAVGIDVRHLRRERVGPLSLAGIPRGAHRELSTGEISSLMQALHLDRAEDRSEGSSSKVRPLPITSQSQHRPRSRKAKP